MTADAQRPVPGPAPATLFVLTQVAVMLWAISNESLWIDEFWTAHFAAMESFRAFYDLLVVPSGSQTPLHFLHFYLWGLLKLSGEFFFRLANLPLFLAGQFAVYWALRDYPKRFSYCLLVLSCVHPMVWQYANEARPYIMMYAGAQMMLAYLLNLHASHTLGRRAQPMFLLVFLVGGILLFGASLLGSFWVLAGGVYVILHAIRKSTWRELLKGASPWFIVLFLGLMGVLLAFYLNSLLHGAGASRLSSSTPATVVFALYEVLGLSGIGPSRLELRDTGATALVPHAAALLTAVLALGALIVTGLMEARRKVGTPELLLMLAFGLFPVVVVLLSGFAMHWRVLGRHLIPALPLLNLIMALGLTSLLWPKNSRGGPLRWSLAILCVLCLVYSALSLRHASRHRKDDYRAAAAVALQAHAQGQQVWWAAGVIGAAYYKLPGEFDVMAELIVSSKVQPCPSAPGVVSMANASSQCLSTLKPPDVVILSKPETFDTKGDIAQYLQTHRFQVVQTLPAFTVWRRSAGAEVSKP